MAKAPTVYTPSRSTRIASSGPTGLYRERVRYKASRYGARRTDSTGTAITDHSSTGAEFPDEDEPCATSPHGARYWGTILSGDDRSDACVRARRDRQGTTPSSYSSATTGARRAHGMVDKRTLHSRASIPMAVRYPGLTKERRSRAAMLTVDMARAC